MSPDCYLMKSICWMRWKSYDSEIWTDHAEFVADGMMLKVFMIAQEKGEPWSH